MRRPRPPLPRRGWRDGSTLPNGLLSSSTARGSQHKNAVMTSAVKPDGRPVGTRAQTVPPGAPRHAQAYGDGGALPFPQAVRRFRWLARLAENALTRSVHTTLWKSLNAWGVLLWHKDIDAEVVALWRSRGRVLIAWTVNDRVDRARLEELGVAWIMTDSVCGDAPPQTD